MYAIEVRFPGGSDEVDCVVSVAGVGFIGVFVSAWVGDCWGLLAWTGFPLFGGWQKLSNIWICYV